MEIVRIFEGNNNLLSFIYDNEEDCEFVRLFDLWNDIEYLDEIFSENKEFLKSNYWSLMSKNEIILKTRDLAIEFENLFFEYDKKEYEKQQKFLDELFVPLSSSLYKENNLRKSKAKKNSSDYML